MATTYGKPDLLRQQLCILRRMLYCIVVFPQRDFLKATDFGWCVGLGYDGVCEQVV